MASISDVKLVIKSLLGSSKDQMTQQDLVRQFYEMTGYHIPFAVFGCHSFEHFLRTIKDTCLVDGTGPQARITPILSSDSAHIINMIARQSSAKKKGRPKQHNRAIIVPAGQQPRPSQGPVHPPAPAPAQSRVYPPPFQQQGPRMHFPQHPQHPQMPQLPQQQHLMQRPQPQQTFQNFAQAQRPNLPPPQHNYHNYNQNKQRPNQMQMGRPRLQNNMPRMQFNMKAPQSQPQHQQQQQQSRYPQSQQVTNNRNDNISNLQAAQTTQPPQQPVTQHQQPAIERENHAKPPPPMHDVRELEKQAVLESVFASTASTPSVASESTSHSSLSHSTNYKVPSEVQENLKELIARFPSGLWLQKLPEEYRAAYNEKIDYVKYRYTSLMQMCCSLDYIFHYKHGVNGGKLYDATRERPEEAEEEILNLQASTPFDEPSIPFVKAIPDDVKVECDDYPPFVMLPGDTIDVEVMPSAEEQLYTEVFVCEVYDLSKFWFCLADKEQAFANLETDIEHFYNLNYGKYKISEKQLVKGLFVVLYKPGNVYQRAVVVKFSGAQVKVFCVDIGTVEETNITNVYFMHRQFTDMPRQGMRGRLARLVPPVQEAQWTRDAGYRFLELVKERRLFGSVDCVDNSQSDGIYDLVLCDASNAEDIFIHDVLIGEKLALASDQERSVSSEPLHGAFEPIVSDLYLYPLFIELELAIVPKASEMRTLIGCRVPLHDIYPQYFKRREADACAAGANPLRQFSRRLKLTSAEHRWESRTQASTDDEDEFLSLVDEEVRSVVTERTEAGYDTDATLVLDVTDDRQDGGACAAPDALGVPDLPDIDIEPPRTTLRPPPGFHKPHNIVPPYRPLIPPPGPMYGMPYPQQYYDSQMYLPYAQPNMPYGMQMGAFNGACANATPAPNVPDFGFRELTNANALVAQNLTQHALHLMQRRQFLNGMYPQAMQPNIPTQTPRMLYTYTPPATMRSESLAEPNSNVNRTQTPVSSLEISELLPISTSTPTSAAPPTQSAAILKTEPKEPITPLRKAPKHKPKKKYVLTTTIFDKTIHIVRIMQQPSVVTSEIQEIFTGKNDPMLLRRYLNMSDVILFEISVDSINDAFRQELSSNMLITNTTTTVQCTCLSSLEDLLTAITNEEHVIPNIDELIYYFAENSPVWNMDH